MSSKKNQELPEEGKIIESPVIRDREEDAAVNRSTGEGTPIYLTSDSTLQSPEEHKHDESVDAREDETMEVSNDDLTTPSSDEASGDALEDDKNNH